MANKNTKRLEEIKKRENKKMYEKQVKTMVWYPVVMLIAALITLLLYSTNWAAIYNTDIGGNEVAITGFNCLSALFTDGFTSTDKSVGDMAVPFYYYAKNECESLSLATLVSLIILCFTIVLLVITIFSKKHNLIAANSVAFLAEAIALIVVYCIAMSMEDGKILPIYCGGNPACSINSMALIPVMISVVGIVVGVLGAVKYVKARKLIS